MTRRVLQLVIACAVLGAGVALLLGAALGSDGYSSLVSGLTIATGLPFAVVNVAIAVALIALAWTRGTRPGLGTLVQPVVVGVVVGWLLPLVPRPDALGLRFAELAAAFVLLTLGVAGYLATETGAGPAEAAALAFDPPVAFRWSYTVLQVGGALAGWALGAAVGPGTIVTALLVGPAVDLARRTLFRAPRATSASPPAVAQPAAEPC
ncbi:hypothetical protein SAMN05216199_1366 [Pedococcus cremeus]|uniref:Membrane protein YczE n=1 Tax=Pedococcus cremeus TaxID=587636 RepID=A0A1H9SXY7_9MICO|nr:hypothetical protein [Pedococcus cremeus]SER89697.1 hypothetical protein SAMN05216199_1366 [Pedococcus cremeus]